MRPLIPILTLPARLPPATAQTPATQMPRAQTPHIRMQTAPHADATRAEAPPSSPPSLAGLGVGGCPAHPLASIMGHLAQE